MPVDIAGLRRRGSEVAVPFFGEEITITYDPITVSSPEFRSQWNRRQRELLGELSDWINQSSERLKALPLPDDFPGRAHLQRAGKETLGDVPTTAAALKKLRGIGNVTALEIINALNNDIRIDDTELDRRRESLFAELAVMLMRDWDLTEGGEPLPIEPASFEGLPGLAKSINAAVWKDANSLGNAQNSSS